MFIVRLVSVCVLALALTGSVQARTAATAAAPDGLKAFLLRIDEPRRDSFSRTPAFAWNPVRGAQRYEFQLSTSSAFRESGVIYSDTSLTTPVAAPALTLPWITGTPHALYARVRAVTDETTTPWSTSFGFDMEPPAVPTPLSSYPGLLRWTPVDGAVAYQVWFVDLPKMVITTTNVVDQREFYTFHQAAPWISSVRWRLRALRYDYNGRANGLPAVAYGPWSPVYTSVNPPFSVGPLGPTATVSDIVSLGRSSDRAHRLTPAFVFGGNTPSVGAATELYRVHVFTDKQCINRVYSSAIIGGPAFAPRMSGPLALPRTSATITSSRTAYLPDGDEGTSFAADMEKIVGNESLPTVAATLGLPAAASGKSAAPAAPSTGTEAGTSTSKPGGSVVALITAKADFGPPIALWDTDWSNGGGYYWTVVGVEARVPDAISTNLAGAGAALGTSSLPVGNSTGFAVGDAITIGNPGNSESATITAIAPDSITVATPLKNGHGAGEPIVRTAGNIQYRDAELAQDMCAAGRVLRFGKESGPALTTKGEAFASGLSPKGRLTSAAGRPSFYGSPLVAWETALGAEAYAVQWSKTRNPFVPQADPATGANGMMTLNTSVVLPLEPGTWYYRVRGYDYSLPTGAQAMSWSDPQQIVATRPTFAVVGSGSGDTSGTRTLTAASAGFSIKLPSSFRTTGRATASTSAGFRPLGARGSKLRLSASEGSRAALFVQTLPDRAILSQDAWARKATAAAKVAGAGSCAQISLAAGAGVRCTANKGGQASVLYLLQHRSTTYALTFAGRASTRGADSARFAAAARSLRFTS